MPETMHPSAAFRKPHIRHKFPELRRIRDLGLTLVKMLTEMHGGTVEASSGGVGQGSEFVVRLPIAGQTDTPETRPTVTRTSSTTPLRILIVDDNRDSVEMLAMLLESAGHETHVARSDPA